MKIQDFFQNYLIHPFSAELSKKQKAVVLVVSTILGFLTLGLLHCSMYYLRRKRITDYTFTSQKMFQEAFKGIKRTKDVAERVLRTGKKIEQGLYGHDNVRKAVQSFVTGYYKKPLPAKDKIEVLIPVERTPLCLQKYAGQTLLYQRLTREEKIALINHYALPHNKISEHAVEFMVDAHFLASATSMQHSSFLPNDPKEHHGVDHAVRASVLAASFGYMYAKYHPQGRKVDLEQIRLAQLTAAGHDSARQSEGPDVYDDMSAQHTVEELKKLGFNHDDPALEVAHNAIASKDADPDSHKSFVAKCVQCADCAEYTRLILDRGYQSDSDLMSSIRYLDIYRELTEFAQAEVLKEFPSQNSITPDELAKRMDQVLLRKEGETSFTYADFMNELVSMKREMNLLIFNTHQRDFRVQLASAENSYDYLLSRISFTHYPSLYSSLVDSGLRAPVFETVDRRKQQVKDLILRFDTTEFYTVNTAELENLVESLKTYPDLDKEGYYRGVVQTALEARRRSSEAHPELWAQARMFEELIQLLEVPFDSPSFVLKATNTQRKIKELFDNAYFSLAAYELEEPQLTAALQDPQRLVGYLAAKSLELREIWKLLNEEQRAIHAKDLTTYGVSIQRIIHGYLEKGQIEEAKAWIAISKEALKLTEHHPLKRLDQLLAEKDVAHFALDSSSVRKRKVRVCKKKLPVGNGAEEKQFYEMCFEIPSAMRPKLQALLDSYRTSGKALEERVVDPEIGPGDVENASDSIELVEETTAYESGKKKFEVTHVTQSSRDLVFRGKEGEQLRIGNSKAFWPLYHQVKIRWPADMPSDIVQRLLCDLGLPSALMISREEDVRMEALGRCVALHAPDLVYQGDKEKRTPEQVLEHPRLSGETRGEIERHVEACTDSVAGHGFPETINPLLPAMAWEGGIRALGSCLSPGNSDQLAFVLGNIFKSGMLSSQERFERGIFGLGCVPVYNMCTGSSNQVFTRAISDRMIDAELKLSDFAVSGPVMVMMNVKLFERMPYFYLGDRGGLRNPHFETPLFAAQHQKPMYNYKGREHLPDRPSFTGLIEGLQEEDHLLNEVMFEGSVPSEYIDFVVIPDPIFRAEVIAKLEAQGIHSFRGVPICDIIVQSATLHKGLAWQAPASDSLERETPPASTADTSV